MSSNARSVSRTTWRAPVSVAAGARVGSVAPGSGSQAPASTPSTIIAVAASLMGKA